MQRRQISVFFFFCFVGQIGSVESKYFTILSLHLTENFILLTQIHDPKINNFSIM